MHIYLIIVFVLFGLCIGSFLNVVVFRLPKPGLSIRRPRSFCPFCMTPIAWYDNIPVCSYLWLKQCCRVCQTYISLRYPVVEVLTGLCFGYVAWFTLPDVISYPITGWQPILMAISYCLFASILLAVTFIDIDLRIIPDELSLGGLAGFLLLVFLLPVLHSDFDSLAAHAFFGKHPGLASLVAACLGSLAGGGLIWSIRLLGRLLFRKEAMGFGDVKLMAMIGALAGWDGSLAVVALASVVGMVYGLASLLITKDRYMPFGPFLALGAFFTVVHKTAIMQFVTKTYPNWIYKTWFQ